MNNFTEKKTEGETMKEQLSLVELATYGYASASVKKGSWIEKTFGNKSREVNNNEHIERSNSNQNERTGR